jgi:hypothetical protein
MRRRHIVGTMLVLSIADETMHFACGRHDVDDRFRRHRPGTFQSLMLGGAAAVAGTS